jgi:hypothetical protein
MIFKSNLSENDMNESNLSCISIRNRGKSIEQLNSASPELKSPPNIVFYRAGVRSSWVSHVYVNFAPMLSGLCKVNQKISVEI